MISLTCTSCKKVLQIDDAFAGGVCRCQHCGTIQTVPASLKRATRAGAAAATSAPSKTLYEKKPRDAASRSGSGLESLAEAAGAASSGGGSGSGLTRSALKTRAPTPVATPRKIPWVPIAIAAACLILLIVLLAIFI